MYRFFSLSLFPNDTVQNYLHSTYTLLAIVSNLEMTSSIWKGMHRLNTGIMAFYKKDLSSLRYWYPWGPGTNPPY
jgi:hypothetical protein